MSDILDRRPAKSDRIVSYGEKAQQFAELRFPVGHSQYPLLFVIHGGFWQNLYDLSHVSHLCAALTRKGFVTCSLEYRRVGDDGGGWPGTFQDLVHGTDKIARELASDERVDIARTAVLGHSAGGHLALWLTCRQSVAKESKLHYGSKYHLMKAISLAGVCDLRQAWRDNLGNGAVGRLMGGSPGQYPDRYNSGSPIELLPTGSKQVLVHGTADDIVPVNQSEKFVERGRALGDQPGFVRLEGIGHFELIDPQSDNWPSVENTVTSMLQAGAGK